MRKASSKRFGLYSVLSAAGGMTFGVTAAEADIIFTDFQGSATQGNPLELDIDNDGVVDFVFNLIVNGPNGYGTNDNWAALSPAAGNGFIAINPSPFGGGVEYGPANLNAGDALIGETFFTGGAGPLQMAYTAYDVGNNFGAFASPDNNSGFVGINFTSGGGDSVFGWIRVTVTGDVTNANFNNASIDIDGYAYALTGTNIVVGQIPEPSSLALLALGATGLAFRRKRDRAA